MSPKGKPNNCVNCFLKFKTHLSNEMTTVTSKMNNDKLLYITSIMAAIQQSTH